jgi:hypothetical protein
MADLASTKVWERPHDRCSAESAAGVAKRDVLAASPQPIFRFTLTRVRVQLLSISVYLRTAKKKLLLALAARIAAFRCHYTLRIIDRSVLLDNWHRQFPESSTPAHYSPHSFRATGITNFLENDGTLEAAQRIAGRKPGGKGGDHQCGTAADGKDGDQSGRFATGRTISVPACFAALLDMLS